MTLWNVLESGRFSSSKHPCVGESAVCFWLLPPRRSVVSEWSSSYPICIHFHTLTYWVCHAAWGSHPVDMGWKNK